MNSVNTQQAYTLSFFLCSLALEAAVVGKVGPPFLQTGGKNRQFLSLLPFPAVSPPALKNRDIWESQDSTSPPGKVDPPTPSTEALKDLKGQNSLLSNGHVFIQVLLKWIVLFPPQP